MRSANFEANLYQLKTVATALGDLLPDVVFVGGCTTALLVDHVAASSVRRTEDVDFIVDITTRQQLYAFNEELKKRGFFEDNSEDAPICRWKLNRSTPITVDVMPTDSTVLGFTNRWYKAALEKPQIYNIDEITINLVTPALFIATKFEAFWSRGKGDYYCRDMEDIIYLLENRSRFSIELRDQDKELVAYIAGECKKIINSEFANILPGLVESSESTEVVLATLNLISGY